MTLFENQDHSHILGEDDIVSKNTLMAELGVSKSTIQRWMRSDGFPYIRFRNYIGYSIPEVLKWLKDIGYGEPRVIARFKAEAKKAKNRE